MDDDDKTAVIGALSVSGEVRKLNSAITGYVKASDRVEAWFTHGSF